MLAVVGCFTRDYNLWLVSLAVLVCGAASFATFSILPRAVARRKERGAVVWPVLAALTAAAGVWSTHFIAMLGYHPGTRLGFDENLTGLSFVIAVAMVAVSIGLIVAMPKPSGRVLGGIGLGLAIVCMHYTGVSGMSVAGRVDWTMAPVALSVLFCVSFSVMAVLVCGQGERLGRRIAAAGLFSLSIVLLHFTGMSAIGIVPDPAMLLAPGLLSGAPLGALVAAGTLVVLGAIAAAFALDLRSRRESEARFRFLAQHDLLTGLPNRLHFQETTEAILAGGPAESTIAVLCLDLDGFKDVNDRFGHPAGDRILVEVAERVRGLLGRRCHAGRLGGDEFAIVAQDFGGERTPASASGAVAEALNRPYTIDGILVNVGCSIGVAQFPADGLTYGPLLARADLALGRAKKEGRGIVRFFDMAMDAMRSEDRALTADLRSAISAGQLDVHYQPKFSFTEQRVVGFEALLRWTHPVRGPIPPTRFIPLAEESGLILPIGEWVLRTACAEAGRWPVPLRIAVNVSPAQFMQAGLVEMIRDVLVETGVAPARLAIEVTEGLFLKNIPKAIDMLTEIQALGARIGMDDFGTGYSSLSTLQSFSFDTLKIDRSFTMRLNQEGKTTAIVRAIVSLAQSLSMEVIAEGVETLEQAELLQAMGCDTGQGYLFGRPRPIADQAELLRPPLPPPGKILPFRLA